MKSPLSVPLLPIAAALALAFAFASAGGIAHAQTQDMSATPTAAHCLAQPLSDSPTPLSERDPFALSATDAACADRITRSRPAGVLSAVGLISKRTALTTELLSDTQDQTGARTRRLESAFTYDDRGHTGAWRFGDSTLRTGSWGRPTRYGGVQWTWGGSWRSGSSALTSAANGSGNLASAVSLGQAPLPVDAGELRLGLRDVASLDPLTALPAFKMPSMLKPGADEITFESGVLREQYGLRDTDYGNGFGAATWRTGLEQGVTTELRAEAQSGTGSAGAGASVQFSELGTLSASLAGSEGERGGGVLRQIGFQRTADLRLAARAEWTNRDFASLGRDMTVPQRNLVTVNAGYTLMGRPIEFAYARQAFFGADANESLTARYALPLNLGARVDVIASRVRTDVNSDLIGLNFSVPLGGVFSTRMAAYAWTPADLKDDR